MAILQKDGKNCKHQISWFTRSSQKGGKRGKDIWRNWPQSFQTLSEALCLAFMDVEQSFERGGGIMKVIIFFPHPLTGFGGLKKVLNILVEYLEKRNFEVLFCKLASEDCIEPDRNTWFSLFQTHETLILRYTWPKVLPKRFVHWFGKYEIIEDKNFDNDVFKDLDLAVITAPSFLQSVLTLLNKIGFKGKIIGWFHGSLFGSNSMVKTLAKKIFLKNSLTKQLKCTDLVPSISSGIEEQVKKLLPNAKVVTVYNPVLPADYEKIPPIKRSTKPIFAYIGRIDNYQKNLKFMFKGLSMLEYDWKLKIIGEGPDEDMLKEYSKKLGIQDRIEWLGFSKEPYELLRDEGVTALLLTSNFEGLGLVLIEAISYGIPVISSDCEAGPRDIVVEGVNGYLYKPGDLRDFVEKVDGLVTGKLKVASPEEMRKTVKKFQIDVVCEKIYDELVKLVEKI